MAVEIKVTCDGNGCYADREIEEDNDGQIERIGWGVDYTNGFHYCPKCWKIVQEELKE